MSLRQFFLGLIVAAILTIIAGYARADGAPAQAGVRVHCDAEGLYCVIFVPRLNLRGETNLNSVVIAITSDGYVDVIDGNARGDFDATSGDIGSNAGSGDSGDAGGEAGK